MSQQPPSPETILAAALEIEGVAERLAYVARASAGHAALRQEVESLLVAHEQAGDFMNPQTVTVPAPVGLAEKPGDRIGRYKLLEQIGEGGFGVVWMAAQEEPVRRRVALKIIKLGMDTKEVVARFEAERQALAMMDHPNIATVFDGGATDIGRPYFVMELVKGVPITDYCDANRLSTHKRLELFMQVCQAVQHAHQKGIIHRDLKPSNILVTVKDDRPVAKVIDFGVAKATQARLTEKTLFTRFQQWIGTPAYMSPEQAGLGSLDVDTRSDVYSLGVLLYELLTGRPPFDTQRLLAGGYDAVMRTIREEEPPKPSTCLSTLAGEELSAVAAKRAAEPAKLNRLVRGDLDWIVMKALEKDRTRRYETASSLALDLDHHLRAEPVSAAAPTFSYRVRKTIRRHSVFVGVAASITLLLLAGVVSTAVQMVRANCYAARLKVKAAELTENLYVSDIYLAHHALQESDYGLCQRTLQALRPGPGEPDRRGFEWRYLWRLSRDERINSWQAHSNAVRSLAVSPDNRLLASASFDGEGKLWDTRSWRCLATFPQADALLFSPEGDLLFAAGNRAQIDIWNTRTLQKEWSFNTGEPLAASQPTVRIAVSPTEPILAFSPDGSFFGGAGSVRLYDYRARKDLGRLNKSGDRMVFSQDGRTLVTGSGDNQIHVWDVASQKKIRSLGLIGGVSSLALSPDGRLLATTEFWLPRIRLWDLENGRELASIPGHETMIWQVAFSPDGRLLASGSSDQTVRLWDAQQRRLVKRLVGHTSEVWSLAFSRDGQRLFSGGKDLTISVWPTAFPIERVSAPVANTSRSPPIFSPDGALLATAAEPGEQVRDVVVLDAASLAERAVLRDERQALWFSAKGSDLLTLSTNAELHLWNLSPLGLRRSFPLPGEKNVVSRAAASPDGRSVAFIRENRPGISLVGVETGQLEAELPSPFSGGDGIAFSPDNHFLAGYGHRTIEIWIPQQRSLVARLNAHRDGVSSVVFSSDMRFMASTSIDNTAKLWRVGDWAELATFSGHREGVMRGTFSPDGKTFGTGCADGTIKLWHLGTHREMASFKPLSLVWYVAFSPDGNSLACAPGAGPLYLLRAPSLEEIDSQDKGRRTAPSFR